MDIKHVFEDSRIVMLEKDIARINEYCRYSDEEKLVMKHLLKKRCNGNWMCMTMRRSSSSSVSMMHFERHVRSFITGRWQFIKNTCIVRTFLEILRWKERYSLVTNILHITPFRQKRQNRCGILSHVEVSIHSMMRVAHGHSDSVESGLLNKVSMRNWRIGWGWKLRTTIGMRDWIENGRKICILYSPFIIYTIIATSHYTTSYMSVSSTWKYMWSLMIK